MIGNGLNSTRYYCMKREMFEWLKLYIIPKKGNKHFISFTNVKVKEILESSGMDLNEIEEIINELMQEIFDKGKKFLYIRIIKNDCGEIIKIELYNERNSRFKRNQGFLKKKIKYKLKIRDFLKYYYFKWKIKDCAEYYPKDYSDVDELNYSIEKNNQNKIKFLTITRDMYVPLDVPEEITTYYHNYRLIKMKMWQVYQVEAIIKQLNKIFEEIFKTKNVIKYDGITTKELKEMLNEFKENDNISMVDLNKKIMDLSFENEVNEN